MRRISICDKCQTILRWAEYPYYSISESKGKIKTKRGDRWPQKRVKSICKKCFDKIFSKTNSIDVKLGRKKIKWW